MLATGHNTPARTGVNTGARVDHIALQTHFDPMGVQTVHRRDETGEQHTYCVVTFDHSGEEFSHSFELVDGEQEYRGAGEPGDIEERDDPPAKATKQLEEFQ